MGDGNLSWKMDWGVFVEEIWFANNAFDDLHGSPLIHSCHLGADRYSTIPAHVEPALMRALGAALRANTRVTQLA